MLTKRISTRLKSAQRFGVNWTWSPRKHCAVHAVVLALGTVPLGLANGAFAQSSDAQSEMVRFVKGRVLVQPRAGLSEQELDKAIKEHGGHYELMKPRRVLLTSNSASRR